MAQTGFTPIQLYSSSTATNVPLAANLATGELAINITDGKLFYKDNSAAVQVIGWKVVPATAGGTGQTSYAVGDLLYANTTTTLAKLPDVATGNALISGGVSTAPSWGKVDLTTHVSGTLPVANGGTNASSASITAFNNITGYSASGATGTTTTNLVFSTSPTLVTPTLGAALATSIKFGSGTVLSSYEEGTWTPTLTSAGGNFTTIAYGDQQGTYTKVGRMVTVRGNLFTSGAITAGSASGQVYIAGLPYACALANLGQIWTSPDTANYNSPLALATGVSVSSSTLRLFKNGTVNNSNFNVTDLYTVGGPSNNFFFQATYFV